MSASRADSALFDVQAPRIPLQRRVVRHLPEHWWKSKPDLWLASLLLIICGVVHGINFDGWPGLVTDDEGTYVAQAYAMQHWHRIAHYTYWYDHPFGGWLLIAVFNTLTGALSYSPTAVTAGRACMLAVHLVSVLLLYMLARRLKIRRPWAVTAVLLFSLPPLSLHYQRLAHLDNPAVMWVLAALVCAASPRRSLAAAAGAGAFIAFAIWSKETAALLTPGVLWLQYQYRDPRNWRFARVAFFGLFLGISSLYLLYAGLKNELFQGPGHVSLLGAIKWQLLDRPGSGSVFDPHSDTHALMMSWLRADPYLLPTGLAAAVACLLLPRMRPIAIVLLIQAVMMLRSGYMPYAYITAALPFVALTIAGVLNSVWGRTPRRLPGISPVVWRAGLAVPVLAVLPAAWPPTLYTALTADDSSPSRQATQWYLQHIPRDSVVLTDNNIWTDLARAGIHPYPIWHYKADLDPAVQRRLPNGWRDIDYVMLGELPTSILSESPTVKDAIEHSVVVRKFDGGMAIRRVVKDQAAHDNSTGLLLLRRPDLPGQYGRNPLHPEGQPAVAKVDTVTSPPRHPPYRAHVLEFGSSGHAKERRETERRGGP